jgi:Zn-dependent peptidase ImmA (M78 family)
MAHASISVKVEPSVLRWARESIGLSKDDVATKLKKTVSIVDSWEKGDEMPTLAQLDKLTIIYKRPLAVFFLPAPPIEKQLNQDFRTLPDANLNALPPEIRLSIRRVKRLQAVLSELYDGKNPIEHPLHKSFKVAVAGNFQDYALELRKHLNISIDMQASWRDERQALNEYKDCFEKNGLFVFQQSLSIANDRNFSARGFSLTDTEFPVIVLNTKDSVHGRIFTIFHELCHILFNTGGIFSEMDMNALSIEAKQIEVFCNAFAGAFLVPSDYLKGEAVVRDVKRPQSWNDNTLVTLSKRYKVSSEVILRRLLDLGLTTNDFYSSKKVEWETKQKTSKPTKKGFKTPWDKCISEKGRGYISSVLIKHKEGRLSYRDVMDYLGISVTQVPKVETILNKYEVRHV